MKKGATHYLVKWKDYAIRFNSFEPMENLNETIHKYIATHQVPDV